MKRIRSGSRYKPIFGTVVALSVLITLFSMSRSLYAQQGQLHSQTGALNAPDKEAREAAAEFIVAREEAAAGRAFDPGYRAKVLKKLASQTSSQLESIQSQSDAGLGILAYGSSGVDLVYTPVTPCRIIDTRLAGGPITPGTNRNFFAAGSGFTSQGGTSGSCGVPFGPAVAVAVNLISVNPTSFGDLRAFPYPQAAPNASVLNYIANETVANGITLTICNPAVTSCAFDFTVQADGTSSALVADIEGYYARLPSTSAPGLTMTGVWGVWFNATGAGQFGYPTFSFPLPLTNPAASPTANFIPAGGASTTSCPGTVGNPQAAAGEVCAYAASCTNATLQCFGSGTGCSSTVTIGATLSLGSSGAGTVNCYGTWAVTSP